MVQIHKLKLRRSPDRHGPTRSERYLKKLCDQSFLSPWSYSGIYRDQKAASSGDGKELCDLLVVFENHILIFSDKDHVFPDTGNLEHDWCRWYRRAIRKSADQIYGAERWIRTYPERIYLDRACTVPFPIDLPDPSGTRFHRVLVAHGAGARCQRELGGSGSLMIFSDVVSEQHCLPLANGGQPFAVGQVDPSKGFLHILDDTSLDIVLRERDTITDFVSYLSRKEELLSSSQTFAIAGEEELLALYLSRIDANQEHAFELPKDMSAIWIDQGFWDDFRERPERRARIEADRISYVWDDLIETFATHAVGVDEYYAWPGSGLRNAERILRFMAREPRTRRRILATALVDLVLNPVDPRRSARIVHSAGPPDPWYMFLVLAQPADVDDDEYRQVRRDLLIAYCNVLKLRFPEAMDIVGIATEPGRGTLRSEDAVYLDARVFTDESRNDAEYHMTELGLLRDIEFHHGGTIKEYPEPESELVIPDKGRDRNARCPCGSGLKIKHCHGKSKKNGRS